MITQMCALSGCTSRVIVLRRGRVPGGLHARVQRRVEVDVTGGPPRNNRLDVLDDPRTLVEMVGATGEVYSEPLQLCAALLVDVSVLFECVSLLPRRGRTSIAARNSERQRRSTGRARFRKRRDAVVRGIVLGDAMIVRWQVSKRREDWCAGFLRSGVGFRFCRERRGGSHQRARSAPLMLAGAGGVHIK